MTERRSSDKSNTPTAYYILKPDIVGCRPPGIVIRNAIPAEFDIVEGPMPARPSVEKTPLTDKRTNAKKDLVYMDEHKYARNPKEKKARRTRQKKEQQEEYSCEVCKQKFINQGSYDRHMIKHSSERPHKCDVCEKAFKRRTELVNHIDRHKDNIYSCDVCSFTTKNRISVRIHQRRMHEADFRYPCNQCDKSFMSNYNLKDHMTRHTGENNFICDICGNAYPQKSHLAAHKRCVHRKPNISLKTFKCTQCPKRFTSEYNRDRHVRIHMQKFLCAECGKEFNTNYSLQMHIRTHTGERPYECEICYKTFILSTHLRVHKLIHCGEKVYTCDLCEKAFTQRSGLMSHRKRHPGNHPPPPPVYLNKLESLKGKLDKVDEEDS
ncbi:PREDICTED: zinc finger protein 664-like [Dufourea novaeangliae]|uniref:zinc finger protein 664-like n=1 Tax=Dufourea novaeangliae TaxID=178035 RepID=UPI0007678234|nr:PREDICTED: zinc finger protein 664-like [Dufourea novaeangliae]